MPILLVVVVATIWVCNRDWGPNWTYVYWQRLEGEDLVACLVSGYRHTSVWRYVENRALANILAILPPDPECMAARAAFSCPFRSSLDDDVIALDAFFSAVKSDIWGGYGYEYKARFEILGAWPRGDLKKGGFEAVRVMSTRQDLKFWVPDLGGGSLRRGIWGD